MVCLFRKNFHGLAVVAALALLTTSPANADDRPAAREIDGLVASPQNFRLILENDQVRVLEYTLLPGKKDRLHTHPQRVTHIASGGKLRIGFPDGRHIDLDEKTGDTVWSGPASPHDTENIGATPVRILLVEVKKETND